MLTNKQWGEEDRVPREETRRGKTCWRNRRPNATAHIRGAIISARSLPAPIARPNVHAQPMSGYGYSEEHQPVTHWRGYPIYAAHFIVIVYCTLMIIAAVLGAHAAGIVSWLARKFTPRRLPYA